MAESVDNVLEIDKLRVHFHIKQGMFKPPRVLRAVDGVSLRVERGKTLGLVGESGCGKSTLSKAVVRLLDPHGGTVNFFQRPGAPGVDLANLPESSFRPLRKHLQMIFQDPYASLDPRMTVRDTIAEPIRNFFSLSKSEVTGRVHKLLSEVGLAAEHILRYPHEFSGGQRQRVGIARALAAEPEVILCDEPVSALDVSIQAQIVNLLQELQERLRLSYIFIAHDLAVVKHISDSIAVMYLGRIVEQAESFDLYRNPKHPYTKALLSAIPIPDPKVEAQRERIILKGDLSMAHQETSGCPFFQRCPERLDKCKDTPVPLRVISNTHSAACHLEL